MPDCPWNAAPRCTFHVRVAITEDPPTYRYDTVRIAGDPFASGVLRLVDPPLVGDLYWICDEADPDEEERPSHTGMHRVVERAWTHPMRGSADWPWEKPHPRNGPLLDLIVVKDEGPFRNEA